MSGYLLVNVFRYGDVCLSISQIMNIGKGSESPRGIREGFIKEVTPELSLKGAGGIHGMEKA